MQQNDSLVNGYKERHLKVEGQRKGGERAAERHRRAVELRWKGSGQSGERAVGRAPPAAVSHAAITAAVGTVHRDCSRKPWLTASSSGLKYGILSPFPTARSAQYSTPRAVDRTLILLTPPLPLVGVSIEIQKGFRVAVDGTLILLTSPLRLYWKRLLKGEGGAAECQSLVNG